MQRVLIAALAVGLATTRSANAEPYEFFTLDVPGATWTEPYGINNLGHIVGSYGDDSGDHGFFYDGSTFREVRFPGELVTNPRDINDLGRIVGYTGGVFDPQRGFLIDGVSSRYLDFPNASTTRADGINNFGDIVGIFVLNNDIAGFLYDGADYSSIVVPQASSTSPSAINDVGTIVGGYLQNQYFEGFSFSNGVVHRFMFGDLPLSDISSAGAAVGTTTYSDLGGFEGFVLPRLPTTSLEIQYINYPGALSTFVEGINDYGVVIGSYQDEAHVRHGFMARPVPEPATWVLTCVALLIICGRERIGRNAQRKKGKT